MKRESGAVGERPSVSAEGLSQVQRQPMEMSVREGSASSGAIAMPRGLSTPEVGRIGGIGRDLRREPLELERSLLARGLKRGFDLIGSLLLLLLLVPFCLAVAVLIKLDSPGPVFFRQHRVGRDGNILRMLKFRTMVDGADDHKFSLLHLNEAADGLFKINADPRVTRVGAFLRATSLDELPQLLHVVVGQMSLVGPRPLVPEEDSQIVGEHRRRLAMRPGMTGVWQVAGAHRIPISEMVQLDRRYLEGWTLWWDLKLLATTAALVMRRGSL
jgi:lipopolysaccharide/colanic/teichoic acid biosynthesis glycosyltransferase